MVFSLLFSFFIRFVRFVRFVLFFCFYLFFFLSASNEHLSLPRRTQVFIYIFYLYLSPLPSSPPNFQVFDFIKMPV